MQLHQMSWLQRNNVLVDEHSKYTKPNHMVVQPELYIVLLALKVTQKPLWYKVYSCITLPTADSYDFSNTLHNHLTRITFKIGLQDEGLSVILEGHIGQTYHQVLI